MHSKELIVKLLGEIACEIDKLSLSELEKLESGEYNLSLKVTKNKVSKGNVELPKINIEKLHSELKECADRESGHVLLKKYLKNRKQLEVFAKGIDVFVMKQDKVDKIRERIVEGVIGATLRSNAIQEI
jgi:hypothetical protein